MSEKMGFKMKHNPPEELTDKTQKMASEIIRTLVNHCPKHEGFRERDIALNILIQACLIFIIGATRNREDAMRGAEGMFKGIKGNINNYYEYHNED